MLTLLVPAYCWGASLKETMDLATRADLDPQTYNPVPSGEDLQASTQNLQRLLRSASASEQMRVVGQAGGMIHPVQTRWTSSRYSSPPTPAGGTSHINRSDKRQRGEAASAPPTPISSCAAFDGGGTFVLTQDLDASASPLCLNFHGADTRVDLDCQGHSIQGQTVISLQGLADFSIRNCVLGTATGDYTAIGITDCQHGVIQHSELGHVEVNRSASIQLTDNPKILGFVQHDSRGTLLENNTFEVPANSVYGIYLRGGGANVVRGNTIHNDPKVDDGIVLFAESDDLIENNKIDGGYDFGIETAGTISNTIIRGNVLDNTGAWGIGGAYYTSWMGNTVADNTIIDSPLGMFNFSLDLTYPDKRLASAQYYFKDNLFSGNKLVYRQPPNPLALAATFYFAYTAPFPLVSPTNPYVIGGNNRFVGNDFGTASQAPQFHSSSYWMFIDGGGNRCSVSAAGSDYPLSCGRP